MQDTPGQTLPGLGVGVWHLQVLCQLSLVPVTEGELLVSLIVDWLRWWQAPSPSSSAAPRQKGGSLPGVQPRSAGAGPGLG